jgi:dTDP-4-amino-4,6-dideoxygalactose transaminase
VNSGTDALFLSLKAYGIGRGDEVITAPNSFLASASVIVASGAKPVFADIREDLNIDPELIEAGITKKTKAIIPVHLTGRPADMERILKIAEKHKLLVIEDAAQAIGAEYRGKKVGSFGNAGCFSLHPLKTLSACGDAGMITTNDKNLYEKVIRMRNIGLKNRDESDIWGYNSRLDTMQAAILLVKFKYLDAWNEKRRSNAAYYMEKLKDVCRAPVEREYEKPVYHTFVIQAEKRGELIKYLEQKGIGTRVHYPIPIHLQEAARVYGYKKGDFPVCEKQSEMILSLPVYQDLTEEDLFYVSDHVNRFYSGGKQ